MDDEQKGTNPQVLLNAQTRKVKCYFIWTVIQLIRFGLLSYRISRACLCIESEQLGMTKDDASRLGFAQEADAARQVSVWDLLIVSGCAWDVHRRSVGI